MLQLILTININTEDITNEELDQFLGSVDDALYDKWGDSASFFFQGPSLVQEEIVTYSEEVEDKMREYLEDLDIDPDTVINED